MAAYNLWGTVLSEQGDKSGAILKYQKAIEFNPKYAPAYNNWGVTLERLGRHKEAEDLFAKARALSVEK